MVKDVNDIKKYNLFLFTSTIARNVIEIFSIIFLYKKNYDIKTIILFYVLIYFLGIIVNVLTLKLIKKINYKYLLFISNILFILTVIYLYGNTFNIYLYLILYSFSTFSFHAIRHYLSLSIAIKKVSNIVLIMFLSLIISSLITIIISNSYIGIVIIAFSIISFLILFKINIQKNENKEEKIKITYKKINFNKKRFFILEQAKILYLIFEPLYLYLYISNSIKYVGLFYVINAISSLIILYFIFKNKTYIKYNKIIITILSITLLLKLNINNSNIILITGILEGILFKIYESYSMYNLYNIKNINIFNYLIINESIFGLTRVILCLIFYIFINDIKIILFMLIIIIYISQFVKLQENK